MKKTGCCICVFRKCNTPWKSFSAVYDRRFAQKKVDICMFGEQNRRMFFKKAGS